MRNLTSIKRVLRKSKTVMLTCHINPDGDAIGSMLALALGLQQLKKEVTTVCRDGIPKMYRSLPGAEKILKKSKKRKYDLVIAVDCGSAEILAADMEIVKQGKEILEIDHHQFRTSFGTISLIDSKAAANGEIVYALLKSLRVKISRHIAQNILTSIIVETNSFRLPQVSTRTFDICSRLMRTGINFARLTDVVYWAQRREAVVLTGICLSRCRFLQGGKIVWTLVEKADFNKIHASDEDVDAVPDMMRSIQGVKISVFFRESDPQTLRVSLRSKGPVNIAGIAREYQGGGHYDVAGCFIANNKKTRGDFLKKIEQILKEESPCYR